MEVHLQLYSILREKLPPETKGRAVLQMNENASIADLLEELNITRRVVISVNGVHEGDRKRQLQDGDEIKLFSSISGGQLFSPHTRPYMEERTSCLTAITEKSCM